MSAEVAGSFLTVGAVVRALTPDFPDVTISKVRFLESEGLVTPTRTASGYRQFSPDDVERLRYVLRAQRDLFWPLKVIKDNLEAIDRGLTPGDAADGRPQPPAPLRDPDVPDADDLLDQAHLAVGGCAEATQVARLDAVGAQAGGGVRDLEVGFVVQPGRVRAQQTG